MLFSDLVIHYDYPLIISNYIIFLYNSNKCITFLLNWLHPSISVLTS